MILNYFIKYITELFDIPFCFMQYVCKNLHKLVFPLTCIWKSLSLSLSLSLSIYIYIYVYLNEWLYIKMYMLQYFLKGVLCYIIYWGL